MRNYSQYKALFSLLLLNIFSLLAQQVQTFENTKRLDKISFENIRVSPETNKTLIISYENNNFRDKSTAISSVFDVLENCSNDSLKVFKLMNDLPVVVTQTSSHALEQFRTTKTTSPETDPKINISCNSVRELKFLRDCVPKTHVNKFDLIYYLQINLMNARFDSIYEVQFNIILQIYLSINTMFTGTNQYYDSG